MSSTSGDRGSGEGRRGLRMAPASGDVVSRKGGLARARPEIDEEPSEEDVERFSNVTRTCPECGKEVFDDAEICYHCGYAFERTTAGSGKTPAWILWTVGLIVVAFVGALALGLL